MAEVVWWIPLTAVTVLFWAGSSAACAPLWWRLRTAPWIALGFTAGYAIQALSRLILFGLAIPEEVVSSWQVVISSALTICASAWLLCSAAASMIKLARAERRRPGGVEDLRRMLAEIQRA